MKAEDLYEAMQFIRPAFLEESDMKVQNQRKKWPRRVLLIAAAAAVGVVSAAAVKWSLRSAARANVDLSEPIPEWTEYQVPNEETPAAVPEKPQPETLQIEHESEPEGGWHTGIILDSTLCSGENVTAFLRVPDISPEIAAETSEPGGEYYFDIGGCRVDSPGTYTSLGVDYVSYDESTQTVLLRVDIFGVENASQLYFAPGLWSNSKLVGYYEEVTIPVTPSSALHTQALSIDLPHDETWGDMRIVAASVYANYVEVEMDVTPFNEVADKERYPDVNIYIGEDRVHNEWMEAFWDYDGHLHDNTDKALADASLLLRDGTRLLITDLPCMYAGMWVTHDINKAETDDELYALDRYRFSHVTTQVIDLSQLEAITINGVDYPLQ